MCTLQEQLNAMLLSNEDVTQDLVDGLCDSMKDIFTEPAKCTNVH